MKKTLFYLTCLIALFTSTLEAYANDNIGFTNYSKLIISPVTQKELVYTDLYKATVHKGSPFKIFQREYKKLTEEKNNNIAWKDIKEINVQMGFEIELFYKEVLDGVLNSIQNKPYYPELDAKARQFTNTSLQLREKILEIIKYYKEIKTDKSIDIDKLNSEYFELFKKYEEEANIFINELKVLLKNVNPDRFNTNKHIIAFSSAMREYFMRLFGYASFQKYEKIPKTELKDMQAMHSYLKTFNSKLSEIQNELDKQSDKDIEAGQISKNRYKNYLKLNKEFIEKSRELEKTMENYSTLTDENEIKKARKDSKIKLNRVFEKYHKADKAHEKLFYKL